MMKNTLLFSVPSKTFLLGEYGVLWGGAALLINTWPRFSLALSFSSSSSSSPIAKQPHPPQRSQSSFSLKGIPKNSPALELLKKEHSLPPTRGFFHHPYGGQGGWGASSAEFALLAAALASIKGVSPLNLTSLLQDYRILFQKKGQGPSPSGADFLSQLQGGLVFCYPQEKKLRTLSWPFQEADLALIATGHSLPTHEHLSSLSPPPSEKRHHLHEQVLLALRALEEANLKAFIKSLQAYGQLLKDCHWVLDRTQHCLQELARLPGILAVKGCGSMGAEVILAVFLKEKAPLLMSTLHERSFHVVARTKDICQQGLLPVMDLQWT